METRRRIVEAAERVMREQGLARTTTKEIARAAGYAEGTLYRHFANKEELFLAVLAERLPSFAGLTHDLPRRVGRDPVERVLRELASAGVAFYGVSFPIAAPIYSEPELLARQREEVWKRGRGPHRAVEAVAAYLAAEQRHGRIRPDADPEAAASLLVGACLHRAFLRSFAGETIVPGDDDAFAASLARTLVQGLSPDPEAPEAASPPGSDR